MEELGWLQHKRRIPKRREGGRGGSLQFTIPASRKVTLNARSFAFRT